jgi:hypothetical protein
MGLKNSLNARWHHTPDAKTRLYDEQVIYEKIAGSHAVQAFFGSFP